MQTFSEKNFLICNTVVTTELEVQWENVMIFENPLNRVSLPYRSSLLLVVDDLLQLDDGHLALVAEEVVRRVLKGEEYEYDSLPYP